MRKLLSILITITITAILYSCSTTSRIAPDEQLYTGVDKYSLKLADSVVIPSALKDQLFQLINVSPNNPLYSPYMRTPLPIGLWIYNNMDPDSIKGFKHWIYDNLASTPVLISDVRPEIRTEMISDLLSDNGYFINSVDYTIITDTKNDKKAKISYTIDVTEPYTIDEIILLDDSTQINKQINKLASKIKYLNSGNRFSLDSLNTTRNTITTKLRNQGYFYFNASYLRFLADSTSRDKKIDIKLTLDNNIPANATTKYKVGDITTTIHPNVTKKRKSIADTLDTDKGELIIMHPVNIREDIITSAVTFKQGANLTVRSMNRTQNYLSRLGVFNSINIEVVNDTIPNNHAIKDTLDININCTMDTPMDATAEFNAAYKTNGYLGPGVSLGLTHRNLFGGADVLNTSFTGSYEWQTGNRDESSSLFNSYEFGINSTLTIPRLLLAPDFIKRRNYSLNYTNASIEASILNRPSYFRMAQFNLSYGYKWSTTRNSSHELTLFSLSYTKLLNTTEAFDSIMIDNPSLEQSFMDQFIPKLSYTYTYTNKFGARKQNDITWRLTLTEAGNIIAGISDLAGQTEDKKLFGIPFSQFIKGETQLVYSYNILGKSYLVSRMLVGAEHPYGNSSQVPYSEQFYIGGANSIRAFAVKSIGPGSYAPTDNASTYYDQTGTFKFEFNMEYRFPLFWLLHGAIFLDTGNIWLLEYDASKPGGELKGSDFFNELAVGTGFGLRFDMEMLVIRADLGIGIHLPYEVEGKSGYYNIPSFGDGIGFHLAIGYPF
ncbi:MAG: BamA/TamA family outer membrane protein [Bacteroidales bacterium]